ncbi:NAD-dependent protein deacetylase [Mesotoga infera]|jgi:NAD-dependent deacetylase|uniref:protein acetyllysine N-acetyltransferase n=1 Tax=Mesotoga infera TaxID=1236046 RepID=A0A7Z7LDV9_9BACT|nr:NAD-dependent protein deacetylase [Mesotoga infera]
MEQHRKNALSEDKVRPVKTPTDEAVSFFELLKSSSKTVVLTGAGVSVASGIPDFRSSGGLYSKVSPEVFELDFFLGNPAAYYRIARERIHTMADRDPNPTHFMLSRLQREGMIGEIITQNIDGLQQRAGAKDVIELHGSVSSFSCMKCHRRYSRDELEKLLEESEIPLCSCSGLIKPDIVFFGEMLPAEAIRRAERAAVDSELFVAMGSSLVVYPAAQFPVMAKSSGATLAIVNRDSTGLDYMADHIFNVTLEKFSGEVLALLDARHQQ